MTLFDFTGLVLIAIALACIWGVVLERRSVPTLPPHVPPSIDGGQAGEIAADSGGAAAPKPSVDPILVSQARARATLQRGLCPSRPLAEYLADHAVIAPLADHDAVRLSQN